MFAAVAAEAGEPVYPFEAFLFDNIPQVLIGIGATIVGAVVRLR